MAGLMRLGLFLALLSLSTLAHAAPLTVGAGESWAFSLNGGQPVKAHRVKATAKPARGEIKATVTALGGTTMTLTNNSATSFTYRAELVGAARAGGRTCTLPPNMVPSLEYWPVKSRGIRLSDFRATTDAGSCPAPGK